MSRDEIIRAVQDYCADLHEAHVEVEAREGRTGLDRQGKAWTEKDGAHVANLLNQDEQPFGLFRFMDEKTGDWRVGYKTKDGREWFHILRQMRNTPGSGLFEGLK